MTLRSQSNVSLLGNQRRISVTHNNLLMIQNDFGHRSVERSSSLASLGNWTGSVLANEVLPTEIKSWYGIQICDTNHSVLIFSVIKIISGHHFSTFSI